MVVIKPNGHTVCLYQILCEVFGLLADVTCEKRVFRVRHKGDTATDGAPAALSKSKRVLNGVLGGTVIRTYVITYKYNICLLTYIIIHIKKTYRSDEIVPIDYTERNMIKKCMIDKHIVW